MKICCHCVCHSYFHVRHLFSLHSGHPSQSVDFGVSDHGNIPELDGLCAQTHVAVQESSHLMIFYAMLISWEWVCHGIWIYDMFAVTTLHQNLTNTHDLFLFICSV